MDSSVPCTVCSSPVDMLEGFSGTYTPLAIAGSCTPSSGSCTPLSGDCTPIGTSPSRGPATPIPGRAVPISLSPGGGWSATTPVPGTSASRLCLNHSDSCSLILPPFTTSLPTVCNYDTKSNLSETNSALLSICRICHMPGSETEILISPCRCAGTLEFIHNTCLMVSS